MVKGPDRYKHFLWGIHRHEHARKAVFPPQSNPGWSTILNISHFHYFHNNMPVCFTFLTVLYPLSFSLLPQTLCQRILTKPNFWQPSLLQNPPTSIKPQLETLLDQCIDPKNVLPHVPKDLLRNLRTLLQSSI